MATVKTAIAERQATITKQQAEIAHLQLVIETMEREGLDDVYELCNRLSDRKKDLVDRCVALDSAISTIDREMGAAGA